MTTTDYSFEYQNIETFFYHLKEGQDVFLVCYLDGKSMTFLGQARKNKPLRVEIDFEIYTDLARLDCQLMAWIQETKRKSQITCSTMYISTTMPTPGGTFVFFDKRENKRPLEPTTENAISVLTQIAKFEVIHAKASV